MAITSTMETAADAPGAVPAEGAGRRAPDVRSWSHRAACIGKTSLFFGGAAERPEARVVRELKASLVCASCPVAAPCREWARAHGEYGFWGGESEDARAAAGYRARMPRAVRRPRRRVNPHRVA